MEVFQRYWDSKIAQNWWILYDVTCYDDDSSLSLKRLITHVNFTGRNFHEILLRSLKFIVLVLSFLQNLVEENERLNHALHKRSFYDKSPSISYAHGYMQNSSILHLHLGYEYTSALREKCPNTEYFLVLILLYSDWIQENTEQKILRIWTLFTHCFPWKIIFSEKSWKYSKAKKKCSCYNFMVHRAPRMCSEKCLF